MRYRAGMLRWWRRAPRRRPRVLFVDQYLAAPNGAGLTIVDLAAAFAAAKRFEMAAWSPVLGELGDRLAALGVAVCARLDDVPWRPDLIHANHLAESQAAAARFPDVPMIRVCHGKTPAAGLARLPSIRAWVGVSEYTCARIVRETGAEEVRRLPNFVDVAVFGFTPRIGDRGRGVLFSNHVRADDAGVRALGAALARHGVALEVVGHAAGTLVADPSRTLPTYGFVLAVGRSALEATALGLPTILCDGEVVGEACTVARLPEMSRHNFAFASGRLPSVGIGTEPALQAVLAARDAPLESRRAAAAWVRANASLEVIAGRYAALYREVLG